ncbi:MAG TPA: hypothetical protein VGK74_13245 [Symbiobacteriaceae bacterium]
MAGTRSEVKTLQVKTDRGYGCAIEFNPSTLEVTRVKDAKFPSVTKEMQTEGFHDVVWLGRARIFDTAHFNYSLFPTVPPANVTGNQIADFNFGETVDTDLEEGPGFAVRECTPLQAVTFWWLEDDAAAQEGDRFTARVRFANGSATVQGTTSTAFTSASSSEQATMVLRMFAVSYDEIRKHCGATDKASLTFEVDGHDFAGSLTFGLANPKVNDLDMVSVPQLDTSVRGTHRKLWWRSRVIISAFPQYCLNNEPMDVPRDSASDGIACVRSGNAKRELFLDGPGYAVTCSPTLNAMAVWWLEEAGTAAEVTATSSIGGTDVVIGATTITGFTSLTGSEMSRLVIRMVQIPLSSIRQALDADSNPKPQTEAAM